MQVVRWLTECGNGVVEGEEQCDDGNTDAGDGCSSVCKVPLSPVLPACLYARPALHLTGATSPTLAMFTLWSSQPSYMYVIS